MSSPQQVDAPPPPHGLTIEPFPRDVAGVEALLPSLKALIAASLSEPYTLWTFRYFVMGWPELCFIARGPGGELAGAVIGKAEPHVRKGGEQPVEGAPPPPLRGYVGMLAVGDGYRRRGLGRDLACASLGAMAAGGVTEIVMEAEVDNGVALALYESLGFVRDKLLGRYYLSAGDAVRLKAWVGGRGGGRQ